MSEATGVVSMTCHCCYERIRLSPDNTTAICFKGPDERRLLNYFAVRCSDHVGCPGFLVLFRHELPLQVMQCLSDVPTKESYGEPHKIVIDYFVRLFGFRPHIGNGVPVEEPSLADLSDEAIAAAITSWGG